MKCISALALILTALSPSVPTRLLAADSWPQFRGPTQQGWAKDSRPPVEWSEKERVAWKTALPGQGWSSPVVADGRIWITTALDEGKSLRLVGVDAATGQFLQNIEVFRNESVPPIHRRNSYASPTPVIGGERVYVHFGSMGTACIDAKSGQKLWENRTLVVDHQNGPGGSPTLYRDKLLITCDGIDEQYEVALDTATGKIAWKNPRSALPDLEKLPADMRKAYGTPLITEFFGKPQSLTTGANRLYSYDPLTGKELWFVDYPRGFSNVPVPVTDGNLVIISTGFNKPEVWAIRAPEQGGNVSETHVVWKQKAGGPDQSSPLFIENRIYMVSSGGIASCLNAADGQIVWKERIGADFAASPLYAGGRIYFFDTAGKTTVIEPGDQFRKVAENTLDEGFMASPAVLGNSLILRTKSHLYRID